MKTARPVTAMVEKSKTMDSILIWFRTFVFFECRSMLSWSVWGIWDLNFALWQWPKPIHSRKGRDRSLDWNKGSRQDKKTHPITGWMKQSDGFRTVKISENKFLECLWYICETHRSGLIRRLLLAANCLWWFLLQDILRWNYHFENLEFLWFSLPSSHYTHSP